MIRRNFLKFGILPILGLTGCRASGTIGLGEPDSITESIYLHKDPRHIPTKYNYYRKIDNKYSWKITRDKEYKNSCVVNYYLGEIRVICDGNMTTYVHVENGLFKEKDELRLTPLMKTVIYAPEYGLSISIV